MNQSIVLGIGTGRCGLRSLAKILNQQPETQSSYEEPPLLPWKLSEGNGSFANGSRGFAKTGAAESCAMWPPFIFPTWRPPLPPSRAFASSASTAAGRGRRQLLRMARPDYPLPTNHWAEQPAPGWHHDPQFARGRFPNTPRRIGKKGSAATGTNIISGSEELRPLSRTDPTVRHLRGPQYRGRAARAAQLRWDPAGAASADGGDARQPIRRSVPSGEGTAVRLVIRWTASRCVILCLSLRRSCRLASGHWRNWNGGAIRVRRVGGYAAIDQGRNQMATDALLDGYEETMWIDADVDFHPDSVDRLRSHGLPIVSRDLSRRRASGLWPATSCRARLRWCSARRAGWSKFYMPAPGFLHDPPRSVH